MLGAVLLVLWCTLSADAAGGIYRVDRQDFSSPSPVARSLGYQNLVNGRPGVYKVDRQDFAGNAPFSQNAGPLLNNMHGYYHPQQKVLYTYDQVGTGYQLQYGPAPATLQPPQPPRLFVPADSGRQDEAAIQPNYKDVLSLSEYNRRFPTMPSQPSVPSYFQPSMPLQTSIPSYYQRPAQSYTSVPSYFQPPVPSYSQPAALPYSQPPALPYSQPPALPYSQTPALPSQPSVTPYWMTSTSPTTWQPPTTTPPPTTPPSTSIPSTAFERYSPRPQRPAANDDDGILSAIPANSEENKPVPPVLAQDPLRKVYVTEDAAGNRHTKVKYHSFDDFVEVSDEHRELLESFGSIQNNESDFAELPEASPIRRRRNASNSQVFSMFSVRNSQLQGAPVQLQDPEQLIGAYVNQLHQQIDILNDMKKAVRNAKLQPQRSSPRTIVASDDSTVIVFNENANFGGQVGQQNTAADPPQFSVPLADSVGRVGSNASEDLLPAVTETDPCVEQSTEPEVEERSMMETTLRDGSHEGLWQRDVSADVSPASDPRDQIIYLTEEPLVFATHSSELWDEST